MGMKKNKTGRKTLFLPAKVPQKDDVQKSLCRHKIV
jgi:hypothetical protein